MFVSSFPLCCHPDILLVTPVFHFCRSLHIYIQALIYNDFFHFYGHCTHYYCAQKFLLLPVFIRIFWLSRALRTFQQEEKSSTAMVSGYEILCAVGSWGYLESNIIAIVHETCKAYWFMKIVQGTGEWLKAILKRWIFTSHSNPLKEALWWSSKGRVLQAEGPVLEKACWPADYNIVWGMWSWSKSATERSGQEGVWRVRQEES